MKFFQSKIAVLACFMALFAITSCTADENLPQPASDLQEMANQEGHLPGEIPDGAASCCEAVGPTQHIVSWQDDIADVLSCCHVETLSGDFPNCNYYPWGSTANNTATVTISSQFPAAPHYSASYINNVINNLALAADANRPGSNWMISDIDFYPYFGCPHNYKCYRTKVTYKRLLCSATGNPQLPKPL